MDNYGELNTIRIDDDAEYHFSTDYIVRKDIASYYVHIERSTKTSVPYLYIEEIRCPTAFCKGGGRQVWDEDFPNTKYKLLLPIGYKVEAFSD